MNENKNQLIIVTFFCLVPELPFCFSERLLPMAPLPLLWAGCSFVRTVTTDEAFVLPDTPGGGG